MQLHEALAALARDHGRALFSDAGAFRGALDDYLDEGTASTGTINLLTDAVRLGALDSLMSMLDTGADPRSAVDTAGRRLARDRGSADTAGSQWAVALLGYALGRVPESMALEMHPDRTTAQPPAPPAPPPATAVRPAAQPGWPGAQQHSAGQMQPPSPPQAWGQPAAPYQQPKKSRTGLIVALAAIAVVVVVGIVIGVIALSGDDGDPSADDETTTTETTSDATGTTEPTETAATDTTPADLGGPVITGDGYAYSVPDGWTNGTDDLQSQDGGGAIDSGALWGETFNDARANVLVETATSFGQSDPEELKGDWINNLQTSTGATPNPIDGVTIGGQPSVGVELIWENPNGITVHQVAYLAVYDDMQYSIAVTTREGDAEALDVYQEILDTWVWQ
jgi:hypothetical protein